MGAPVNPRGGFAAPVEHPFYWPAVKVVHAPMTPRVAWGALQSGEITPASFAAVLKAWSR